MVKSKKPDEKKDDSPIIREGDNISTLREILFGNKVAEFEKRFDTLEKHLNQELSNIRSEVDKLYQSLESFFKEEQKSLLERFKDEREERLESEKSIRNSIESLNKKVATHKEENSNSHREIRQSILEQNKKFSNELQELKRELNAALDDKTANLDDKKINRLALADLLTEVALQLGQESHNPSNDA